MNIRPSRPEEREAVLEVAYSTGVFNAEEVGTVAELFDDYLADPESSGYYFLSAVDGEAVLGFACWGPTDLSQGATDLYWIATAGHAQGRGVGAALFHAVEAEVQALGRWLIIIWTSSLPTYAPARCFYERMGCPLAAQIKDFYARGEDLCIYIRHL